MPVACINHIREHFKSSAVKYLFGFDIIAVVVSYHGINNGLEKVIRLVVFVEISIRFFATFRCLTNQLFVVSSLAI